MIELVGRAVLRDGVVPSRIGFDGPWIERVAADPAGAGGPYLAPGFIDLHVHGFGGHDAMGGPDAILAMARALVRRGVTAFLPTAVSAPIATLHAVAAAARAAERDAMADGAAVLGVNLEGPFLASARRGAHAAAHLRAPDEVDPAEREALVDGLRVTTVAPELAGALRLIEQLSARGVVVALGHSDATSEEARRGYAAGARSTTHLFNAMSGVDHRRPGLAVAALTDDAVAVELIADGHHVSPDLWPLVWRAKPDGRLLLVSDAIPAAGLGDGASRIGDVAVDVRDGRATVAGSATLAGSVIGLDDAVRNLVGAGAPLPLAVAAASANAAQLLGDATRGEIAIGRRADLVELDDDLRVRRVWLAGRPIEP